MDGCGLHGDRVLCRVAVALDFFEGDICWRIGTLRY